MNRPILPTRVGFCLSRWRARLSRRDAGDDRGGRFRGDPCAGHSTPDLLSTQDAVVLAREAGASYLVVFNAVDPKKRFAENARESREQALLASLIACRQYLL